MHLELLIWETEDMAQWVKCLPHKHEAMTAGPVACVYNPTQH